MSILDNPAAKAAMVAYFSRSGTRKILQCLGELKNLRVGDTLSITHEIKVNWIYGDGSAQLVDTETGEVIWPKDQ